MSVLGRTSAKRFHRKERKKPRMIEERTLRLIEKRRRRLIEKRRHRMMNKQGSLRAIEKETEIARQMYRDAIQFAKEISRADSSPVYVGELSDQDLMETYIQAEKDAVDKIYQDIRDKKADDPDISSAINESYEPGLPSSEPAGEYFKTECLSKSKYNLALQLRARLNWVFQKSGEHKDWEGLRGNVAPGCEFDDFIAAILKNKEFEFLQSREKVSKKLIYSSERANLYNIILQAYYYNPTYYLVDEFEPLAKEIAQSLFIKMKSEKGETSKPGKLLQLFKHYDSVINYINILRESDDTVHPDTSHDLINMRTERDRLGCEITALLKEMRDKKMITVKAICVQLEKLGKNQGKSAEQLEQYCSHDKVIQNGGYFPDELHNYSHKLYFLDFFRRIVASLPTVSGTSTEVRVARNKYYHVSFVPHIWYDEPNKDELYNDVLTKEEKSILRKLYGAYETCELAKRRAAHDIKELKQTITSLKSVSRELYRQSAEMISAPDSVKLAIREKESQVDQNLISSKNDLKTAYINRQKAKRVKLNILTAVEKETLLAAFGRQLELFDSICKNFHLHYEQSTKCDHLAITRAKALLQILEELELFHRSNSKTEQLYAHGSHAEFGKFIGSLLGKPLFDRWNFDLVGQKSRLIAFIEHGKHLAKRPPILFTNPELVKSTKLVPKS